MIRTSYSHPVLQAYRIDKIKKAIAEHMFNENDNMVPNTNVTIITQKDPNLPSFYHPINRGQYSVVIDGRSFTRPGKDDDDYKVTNQSEMDFNVLRAQLELAWQNDGRFAMVNNSSIPAGFYVKWISEAITRVYNLDPENQMRVSIIAGLYFFCQFRPKEEWDEQSPAKALSFIARATRVTAQTISDIMGDRWLYVEDMHGFVSFLKGAVNGEVLNDLQPRSLYTILSSNWRGAHANEIAILAISYPPAFYAMIVSAYNDRSYKNTPLQQLIDRTKKTVDTKSWTFSVKSMLVAIREDWS